MKEDLTEIVCVIDRSGSMSSTKDDAIGGFNTFLAEQKELEGSANLSLVLFDNEYLLVHDGIDVQEVPDLDDTTFVPRGSTALYDAVGRAIDDVGARLASLDEADRPGKVIFVILTDGAENASQEYSLPRIKDMIEHQREKYSWEFVFLGANIDASAVASSISIPMANSVTYAADSLGTQKAARRMARAVSSYRGSGTIGNWKDDEDEDSTSDVSS